MWIGGSILLSIYVYHFSNYNRTYGSLGMPFALLTWIWMSVFVVLLGAEINGQAKRQKPGIQR
jgi:membrane protein